jgi:hypothetical protein
MAIQITNSTLKTQEGFDVKDPWIFVDQHMTGSTFATFQYYKSKQDYLDGNRQLNVAKLPNSVVMELTNSQFWGESLAEDFHKKCIDEIEKVTGIGTCVIDKTEF